MKQGRRQKAEGRRQSKDAGGRSLTSVAALRLSSSAFYLLPSAFTLVEILASLLFLAIAVPAIVAALGLASRTSEVAERGSIAGNLAENKLNEMLVDNAWQSAAQSNGDFGSDHPFYHWQMSTQAWTGGNSAGTLGAVTTGTGNAATGSTTTGSLTELSIDVFYPVQGGEHSVRLTTLVSTSSTTGGSTTTTGTSSSSTTR